MERRHGDCVRLFGQPDGEPTEFAEARVLARQAEEAAKVLGVDRVCLGLRDRFPTDTASVRIEVARLIRFHRPRRVNGTGEACVQPDHAAAVGLTPAAVFLARLRQWDRIPGGKAFAGQDPWPVERLFFPYRKVGLGIYWQRAPAQSVARRLRH